MILAAGLGERMRPLTDTLPKALLPVAGRALIEWQLERLVGAGFTELVVNLAYRGAQIRERLGDGAHYGAQISYSDEGPQPLETGGGIYRALPLLGDAPFLVVNADVWTDFPYAELLDAPSQPDWLAELVLVANPPQHPAGDFVLRDGLLEREGAGERLTFAGISVLRPALFDGPQPGPAFSLLSCLLPALRAGRVAGRHYEGAWEDIGTPERLARLDAALAGATRA